MSYPGIDRSDYPGDGVMRSLLTPATNLTWTGYYLAPAPNHKDQSWIGTRSTLVQQGWGFAPIYVGQQQYDPAKNYSTILTPQQGVADGVDAANLAQQEGFPSGCVIYLDIEAPLPTSDEMIGYAQSWAQTVQQRGYRAGIYCIHTVYAQKLLAAMPATTLFWIVKIASLQPVDPVSSPFPTNDLSDSGYPGVAAWQYAQDGNILLGSSTLKRYDMDLASSMDPSTASNPGLFYRILHWLGIH